MPPSATEPLFPDGSYGYVTKAAMTRFQDGIPGCLADGSFGPETRRRAKEFFGFDFEAAAERIHGTTQFVQPDGAVISWSPDAEGAIDMLTVDTRACDVP